MKPDALFTSLGVRFLRVYLLPTFAASAFLLILVWAGAPGGRLQLSDAWKIATNLKASEILALFLSLVLLALLVQPFHTRLTRLYAESLPAPLRPVNEQMRRRWAIKLKQIRKQENQLLKQLNISSEPLPQIVREIGMLGSRRKREFPPEPYLRPTRLGNALAAAEHNAGRSFGWDAALTWPRLYPVLDAPTRTIVDDHRNALDAAIQLTGAASVTTLVSGALLVTSGPWLLLVVVPLVVAMSSYRAAVEAAFRYGQALDTAIELHRFVLLDRLHLPLPATRNEERIQANDLCTFWRQDTDLALIYRHQQPESDAE
jgi:hypothetical protein